MCVCVCVEGYTVGGGVVTMSTDIVPRCPIGRVDTAVSGHEGACTGSTGDSKHTKLHPYWRG